WYENLGAGTFGPQRVIPGLGAGPYGTNSVRATDLDGDGDPDVLVANEEGGNVAWAENLGGGTFGPAQHLTWRADGAESVHADDMDGDGDLDVLSASRGDSKIAWYENLGAGVFGPQSPISEVAEGARAVFTADLNGNGNPDVLSANSTGGIIAWYRNEGAGTFGALQVITTEAAGACSVFAKDLDGDGDADVLSASADDDKIAWYENLGGGIFGSQKLISTEARRASSVIAKDLDGDGDPDVLSTSRSDRKVAWYENLGGGAFGAQQVLTTDEYDVSSVDAADLDGDGDVDVVSGSGRLTWYENLGGGTFGAPESLGWVGPYGTTVHAVDLDGDGDPDLVSGTHHPFSYDNIVWHENLGGGRFGPPQRILSYHDGDNVDILNAVFTADLDGDGDADVLSASWYDDKIAWYENLMGQRGVAFCGPAAPNSTGLAGSIEATGSLHVSTNRLTLRATNLPQSSVGFFLTSQAQGFTPNPGGSQGALCLGGSIGRFVGPGQIRNSGSNSAFSLTLNLAQQPTPTGLVQVQPGDTWNFQTWFRDVAGGQATSNFTGAVELTFQ
ncbi:MAG: VCBS repeat-containing protein, partial [Planctomycetota bacterium]|nr:VCBS repeat-containing protein [Planctomycetota bacterium]